MVGMNARIEKGSLVVTIPLTEVAADGKYPVSPTMKTRQVASSHGNTPTPLVVDGQPVIIGLNAYIRNK